MLHIILLILKGIGIALAVVLAILLLVFLLFLFVPAGYSASFKNQEKLFAKARVWWLFHFFHGSFTIEGKSPVIKVRILGIPIIDSSRKKKERSSAKEAKKRKERPKEGKPEKEGGAEKIPELTIQQIPEKEEWQRQDKETVEEREAEPEKIQAEERKENREEPAGQGEREPETKEEAESEGLERPMEFEPSSEPENPLRQKAQEKKKRSPAAFIRKIKDIRQSLKDKWQSFKEKRQVLFETAGKLKKKAGLIKAFLQLEENQKGIGRIFGSLKGIIKHVLPRKLKGQVRFGLGDPCSTGQILGILAILYPYYGKQVAIEPDFTGPVLEGQLYLKGHIRMFTLGILCIKLLLDDNFRKLKRNFIQLKEEL